jgi:multidrug resistance efflux pump
LPWLLGLILLTGSLIGATQVLHSRQTEAPPQSKPATDRNATAPHSVVCLGTVAIDGGVPSDGVGLFPMQPGEVTEVLVYEGQNVRAGDILLRVNDEALQQMVVQAELGIRAAEADLAKARQGPEQHRWAVETQRAKVDAARYGASAGAEKLSHVRMLKETFGRSNDSEIAEAEQNLKAGQAIVVAQEAELHRIEALRPESDVEKATVGVELARAKRDQARLALDNCVLKAKEDGTILRLNNLVKGGVVSSQMRPPPIQFAPARPRIIRAEVSQEFAHRVHEGLSALVEDFALPDITWQGTVKNLAPAYLPRRTAGTEAFSLGGGNEAWVRECVIELAPSQNPPLPGQRVRVRIAPRTP